MKQIYFHVDEGSMPLMLPHSDFFSVKSFENTWKLIDTGADIIHTTDMSQMCFDLLDLGYEMYLCYKDKRLKLEPGMKMEYCEKEIRRAHNIHKLFLAGVFDADLGIDFKDK